MKVPSMPILSNDANCPSLGFLLSNPSSFSITSAVVLLWLFSMPVQAIPVADNTLGRDNSRINNQDDTLFQIEGGATRGSSLFHSFEAFSIEQGNEVHFLQPSASNPIEIMITRVTGDQSTLIDGLLSVEGNADLFFMNPNGIMFGRQAELDIGGSFIATTAEQISFGDEFAFQTDEPNSLPPLLSINSPTGLQFGENPGAIENLSVQAVTRRGLELADGGTLGLIGGKVSLGRRSFIQVPSGRVEIGSVGPNGEVALVRDNNSWRTEYQSANTYRNIVARRTSISVDDFISHDDESSSPRRGAINLQGRNIYLRSVERRTDEIGGVNTVGVGGNLTISATESVAIENKIRLSRTALNGSTGGSITIETPRLILNQAGIATTAFSGSTGGDIDIKADSVLIDGSSSFIRTEGRASSFAGNLTITGETLRLRNGAQLDSGLEDGELVEESGTAGNIAINVPFIFLDNEARINVATTGGEGNIDLNTDFLILNSGSEIIARGTGIASGGDITINTGDLIALNASKIDTTAEAGTGGDILIITNSFIRSPDSILDASSQSGTNGTIEILTPDSDPGEERSEEGDQPLDVANLVNTESCTSRRDGSSFYMVGRGGLRESPLDPLPPYLMWEDWETAEAMMPLFDGLSPSDQAVEMSRGTTAQTVAADATLASANAILASSNATLAAKANPRPVEMQGWMRQEDGTIVLLSQPGTTSAQGFLLHPQDCQMLQEGLRG